MNKKRINWIFLGIIIPAFIIGLSGCQPAEQQITDEATEAATPLDITASPAVDETENTPEDSPDVILGYDPGAETEMVTRIQTALESLAGDNGLSLEVLEELTPERITTSTKVVVGVGLDLTGLAQANPTVQFIAIDDQATVPLDNLSVIGDSADTQRVAFMGGYLAALISGDYKVSALVPEGVEESGLILEAFINGARFFCGICQPKYPPYNTFPSWQTLALENASSNYQSTVDALAAIGTEVVYLPGSLQSPELLTYFNSLDMKVISDQPAESPLMGNWVGTLGLDPVPALESIWLDILTGLGGHQVPAAITLSDTENGLISEGRYRMFEEMIVELETGQILIELTP
jgi:hypothetical protein